MEKKKLKIKGLKVTSFITVIDTASQETLIAGDAGGATGQALNCPRIEYVTFQHRPAVSQCCANSDNRTNCGNSHNTDNASKVGDGAICRTYQEAIVSASMCYLKVCNNTAPGILCGYV